jgi:hypothetical protein
VAPPLPWFREQRTRRDTWAGERDTEEWAAAAMFTRVEERSWRGTARTEVGGDGGTARGGREAAREPEQPWPENQE